MSRPTMISSSSLTSGSSSVISSTATATEMMHPHQNSSAHTASSSTVATMIDCTNEPMRNYDGTEMRDSNSCIVYKSQFLSTHPLRSDCKERVGYAGMKLTYVSGDGVIRTMNAIFGHGGWSSQITMERNILDEKDDRGRWNVGYIVSIRVTLLNGASHEDCGSGEGIDNSKIKAHEKAIKSAITDGMKRAARHFGERLGNALYVKGCGIKTAPKTNREALMELERKDALNLFGDQAILRDNRLHTPDEHQSLNDESTELEIVEPTTTTTVSAEVNATTTQYNTLSSSINGAIRQHQKQQQQQLLAPCRSASMSVLPSPTHSSSTVTQGSLSHTCATGFSTTTQMNILLPRPTLANIPPQPPSLMAPPTRPIIHSSKRYVDGIENQYNKNMHVTIDYSNGDHSKRLKANPYNYKNNGG